MTNESIDLFDYLKCRQVSVEVRKIRRRTELPMPLDLDVTSTLALGESFVMDAEQLEAIGHAKILTVRQFYYIFCFLSGMCVEPPFLKLTSWCELHELTSLSPSLFAQT